MIEVKRYCNERVIEIVVSSKLTKSDANEMNKILKSRMSKREKFDVIINIQKLTILTSFSLFKFISKMIENTSSSVRMYIIVTRTLFDKSIAKLIEYRNPKLNIHSFEQSQRLIVASLLRIKNFE